MKTQFRSFRALLLVATLCIFHFEGITSDNAAGTMQVSQEAILNGANLFDGTTRLANGGAACNSCHNVNNSAVLSGGLLGKDLTDVYTRMGDAGLSGILGAPPFPAMASAYNDNRLTDEEIEYLKAFLQFVDVNSDGQEADSNDEIFLLYGPIGLIVWLVLVYFFWFNRKKESVKKAVFDRQIKPIN